jgi:hypothetical protein
MPRLGRSTSDIRILAVVSAIIASAASVATSAEATDPFKKVLNADGYILISPAQDWVYPGGLLFVKKGSKLPSTFVDLPDALKPQPKPATVVFPAGKTKKSFSLSALLTGFATMIGGNPGLGIGHDSTADFKQLDATGARINPVVGKTILANPEVTKTVRDWIKKPNDNQLAFMAAIVLTTSEFSLTTSSKWNADVSFNGSPLSKCGATSNSPNSNTATTSTTTTPTKPNTTAKLTKPGSATKAPTPGTSAASSVLPGGELHFCYSNDNTLSMNTKKPLIFAIAAWRITESSTGELEMEPIYTLTPNGEAEMGKDPTAGTLPETLKHSQWPPQL